MSPSMECTELKVSDTFEQTQPLIIIRLNDPEVFDAGEFDALVRTSMKPTTLGDWSLKYIVHADTMYIFPDNIRHDSAESALGTSGITGELQSAGYVWFADIPDSPRTINGYSTTLLGKLSQRDSEAYKNTVIKEALRDFFQVT